MAIGAEEAGIGVLPATTCKARRRNENEDLDSSLASEEFTTVNSVSSTEFGLARSSLDTAGGIWRRPTLRKLTILFLRDAAASGALDVGPVLLEQYPLPARCTPAVAIRNLS